MRSKQKKAENYPAATCVDRRSCHPERSRGIYAFRRTEQTFGAKIPRFRCAPLGMTKTGTRGRVSLQDNFRTYRKGGNLPPERPSQAKIRDFCQLSQRESQVGGLKKRPYDNPLVLLPICRESSLYAVYITPKQGAENNRTGLPKKTPAALKLCGLHNTKIRKMGKFLIFLLQILPKGARIRQVKYFLEKKA